MQPAAHLELTFVSDRKPPWSALATSFAVQAVGVALLAHFGVIKPKLLMIEIKKYEVIQLATDVESAHPRPPQKLLKIAPPPKPELDRLLQPRLKVPAAVQAAPEVVAETKPPVIDVKPQVPAAPRVPQVGQFSSAGPTTVAVAKAAPSVQTGAFSSGSSAVPTLPNVKSRDVQTGGFGDPNGIKGVGKGDSNLIAAAVGSFDLPGGPGYGNGTGGAKGVRGTVASAGFGNGVATANPGRTMGGSVARGSVQQGGFADSHAPAAEPKAVRASLGTNTAATTPVEILSKPNPVYTEEARAMKIEGEVVLQVLFEASGAVHVGQVVHGLGHGLDASAVRAAERIKFKPARRDGQPVDSSAVIHVVFQLAY